MDLPRNYFWFWYYKSFKSSRTFEFRGDTFSYYYHQYGKTWKNEGSVEIPIIWDIVKNYRNKSILEVGNVLSYRFHVSHDILDKYDIRRHVINEDVVDFNPPKKYDLIVSISTLEHVGWDETPKDPRKILYAFHNLRKLLASGGQIIVTLPIGYNPEMDKLLRNGDLRFDEQYYLKRFEKTTWQEVCWEDVKDAEYDISTPSVNGLIIGVIRNVK